MANLRAFWKVLKSPAGLVTAVAVIVVAVVVPPVFKIVPVMLGAGLLTSRMGRSSQPVAQGTSVDGWAVGGVATTDPAPTARGDRAALAAVLKSGHVAQRANAQLLTVLAAPLASEERPLAASQTQLYVNDKKQVSGNIFPKVLVTDRRLVLAFWVRGSNMSAWSSRSVEFASLRSLTPYVHGGFRFEDADGTVFRVQRPFGSPVINRAHRAVYAALTASMTGAG